MRILDYEVSGPDNLDQPLLPDLVEAIVNIWKDPIIPRLLDEEASQFYLMDSAP